MKTTVAAVLFSGLLIHAHAFAASSAILGASYWRPSDSNTNYLVTEANTAGPVDFALFAYDTEDGRLDMNNYLLFRSGDQISFSETKDTFVAVNDADPQATPLVLGDGHGFVIGARDGGNWLLDDGTPTSSGRALHTLRFEFADGTAVSLLQSDAKLGGRLVLASAVPLPGAAWLLGSGLAALVLAQRRIRRQE